MSFRNRTGQSRERSPVYPDDSPEATVLKEVVGVRDGAILRRKQ